MLVTLGGAVARPGITELALGHDAADRARALRRAAASRRRRCSSAATSAPGCRPRRRSTLRSRRPVCDRSAPPSARARSRCCRERAAASPRPRGSPPTWRGESAGQCGPCVFGLRAIAEALDSIAACDQRCGRARSQRLRRAHAPGRPAAAPARIRTAPRASSRARSRSSPTNRPPPRRRVLGALAEPLLPTPAARGMAMSRKTTHLRVNPIRCDAYGHCAELLPELISLDEWGYPIIADAPVPRRLRATRRAAPSRYARGSRSCSSSATQHARLSRPRRRRRRPRRPERDRDERPAAGGVGGGRACRRAPRRPGARSPGRGPSPGMPRALVGAVEAVEHVREVGLVETRAVIADRERAVAQVDLDQPARRAPLVRVAEQVRDRAADALGLAADDRRLEVRPEHDRVAGAALGALDQLAHDLVDAHVVDDVARLGAPRASSTTSPTSAVSSSSSAMMSARRLARSSSGSRSASSSTWMLARRLAIGVRSSWLASATRWRCASTECSSASSVALKLRARRASSSSPSTSSRCERSGFGGQRLGRRVKRETGASAARATMPPSTAATRMPPPPTASRISSSWRSDAVDLGQRPRDLHGAARRRDRP